MPPKKKDTADGADGAAPGTLLQGFTDKETKLLAAAFLSSIGPDKYNYDDMAALTTNTAGSLKKMWPPVKKKAIEKYASFGAFLGAPSAPAGGEPKSAAPKVNNGKKRKAADENPEDGTKDLDPTSAASIKSDSNKADSKKKTTAKGGNRNKKAKKEKADSEAEKAEDSADGGDGLGDIEEEEV